MEELESKRYWIWLSLIKNLGSLKLKRLLDMYHAPKRIWDLTKEELININGIGEKTAEQIICNKYKENLENYILKMQNKNIGILTINDEEYPTILKEIYDPPICLYYKGNKNILNNIGVAIVGCRECTNYGKKVAESFSYSIAKNNINIVSGLAKGIDTFSHIGAIYAKGKTIAVVGNGLDVIYPKENEKIINKIIELGGCIISEYPLGTKPERMNFPARNRIISGLSKGVIVVEAKKKSGTLITVDFALEQGKDVFVVPGNINSINSIGTNDLIKQGAKLVTCYQDVLQEYKNIMY